MTTHDGYLVIRAPSQYENSLSRYGFPIVKMRRSWDHLIFITRMENLDRWNLLWRSPRCSTPDWTSHHIMVSGYITCVQSKHSNSVQFKHYNMPSTDWWACDDGYVINQIAMMGLIEKYTWPIVCYCNRNRSIPVSRGSGNPVVIPWQSCVTGIPTPVYTGMPLEQEWLVASVIPLCFQLSSIDLPVAF